MCLCVYVCACVCMVECFFACVSVFGREREIKRERNEERVRQ